jgi:leucyl/phenylalanyl-tRNA--protein transferase
MTELTPDLLLRAYTIGLFPMAETAEDPELFWVDPERRGVIPLEAFHVPRSLRKTVRRDHFEVRVDSDFLGVLDGCAEISSKRRATWINSEIVRLYGDLHRRGFAHSVECWRAGRMVGGLYGVALGGAFFGESMFSRETDASKVALVHLVVRLVRGGYTLLDTQFVTPHLAKFGAVEITRAAYRRQLARAIEVGARFPRTLDDEGEAVMGALLTSPRD